MASSIPHKLDSFTRHMKRLLGFSLGLSFTFCGKSDGRSFSDVDFPNTIRACFLDWIREYFQPLKDIQRESRGFAKMASVFSTFFDGKNVFPSHTAVLHECIKLCARPQLCLLTARPLYRGINFMHFFPQIFNLFLRTWASTLTGLSLSLSRLVTSVKRQSGISKGLL